MSEPPGPKPPRRTAAPTRRPKGQRAREALFPNDPVFDAKRGRFSPLPWQLRTLLFAVSPRGWQIFCYLLMRAGQDGVTWITDREIAFNVDLHHRKLAPYLRELVDLGLIASATQAGERFLLLRDPDEMTRRVLARPDLPADRRDAIMADLEVIGVQTPVAEESQPRVDADAAPMTRAAFKALTTEEGL